MTLAFVFPGQGSQSVGMLSAPATVYPEVRQTFGEGSAVLGYDLWNLVQNGPESELNQTDKTQPAMLAAGVAVWRIWQARQGRMPSVMAGHSLGEYTALVCAGALDFADAVRLVAERGRYMQEAVPAGAGAMAAILGLEDAQVIQVCAEAAQGEVVAAVNFNSPGQVVVAGGATAVARAVDLAKQAGAKRTLILPVSVPSHCLLMKPAAERLAALLRTVPMNVPRIPVINNVDVAIYDETDKIRDALVRQLYNPVRWVDTIRAMNGAGVKTLVECGPGKVLAGLNKRIDKDMVALPVFDPVTLDEALQAV
ncbi:MAG: ACP S-malonyltransferase [Gammaproteobacteria bacterium]|nr:ACP S-malonyltransferase [Gammaproteobacteria bacterium]